MEQKTYLVPTMNEFQMRLYSCCMGFWYMLWFSYSIYAIKMLRSRVIWIRCFQRESPLHSGAHWKAFWEKTVSSLIYGVSPNFPSVATTTMSKTQKHFRAFSMLGYFRSSAWFKVPFTGEQCYLAHSGERIDNSLCSCV